MTRKKFKPVLNRVQHLPAEMAEQMRKAPLKAEATFRELDAWRRRSARSTIVID